MTEFLLARIAEDWADAMSGWRWKALGAGEYERLQARVLAECETKRRIVALHGEVDPCDAHDGATFETVDCETLQVLALPYADHPDYDEEWRP